MFGKTLPVHKPINRYWCEDTGGTPVFKPSIKRGIFRYFLIILAENTGQLYTISAENTRQFYATLAENTRQ